MEKRPLTTNEVKLWLDTIEPNKEFHYTKILNGLVQPDSYPALRRITSDLVEQRLIKSSGLRDGNFVKIKKIEPVKWWEANAEEYYELRHPMSHVDQTTFAWQDMVNFSPGDVIIIGGVSNFGKSCLALNYLAENMDKHECLLMGNEYTALDGMPSPKFKRRMGNMKWANYFEDDGSPKFQLLPVNSDFGSYVESGKLNIIDWINMPEQPWMIGRIIEDIKKNLGMGMAVIVLQKSRFSELAYGGQGTEHFTDFYITLDPYGLPDDDSPIETRVTLGKVKDPKEGVRVGGRSWAFQIVDGGANLKNIREVIMCKKCKGKGRFTTGGSCSDCYGNGWTERNNVYEEPQDEP
jgi:hypothetical protein